MTLAEAKERIEYILNSYNKRFEGTELIAESKITYQNDECDDCAEDDAKMSYICGEFFIRLPDMSEEDGLGYCMIVDCQRKNKIDEKKFNIEATEFCENMDKMINEVSEAIDIKKYLTAEIQKAEEESERLMAELNTTLRRVDKTLKITSIVAGAIIVIGIVVAILL